ncbi:MAG: hypothetical protein H6574_02215 [Lewinellaceae bacterium]|nr:hypothetical protein [Saprospiraceae bacterium]MCB9315086.1 hypothetical protein [Lewinellaceae bacterium]MCB9329873.1 hypothetical protein [Lewinellaceae bacterium]
MAKLNFLLIVAAWRQVLFLKIQAGNVWLGSASAVNPGYFFKLFETTPRIRGIFPNLPPPFENFYPYSV